jgi:metal transporter CNNM
MRYNGYTTSRPAVLGLAKVVVAGLCHIPAVAARPLWNLVGLEHGLEHHHDDEPHPEDASLWLYLSIAAILVLLGGAFAGLTIA